MSENDKFIPVIETLDLLREEIRQARSGKLHFRIVHRFRMPGTDCMAGEEIIAIDSVRVARNSAMRAE